MAVNLDAAIAKCEAALVLTQRLVDDPDPDPKLAAADLAAHAMLKRELEILKLLASGDVERARQLLTSDGEEVT